MPPRATVARLRLLSVIAEGFRALDVRLPLHPTTVLFGPNGSGKTNLLDALELGFGQTTTHPRPDPDRPVKEWDLRADLPVDLQAVVELDGIGIPGHPDERLFCELVQYEDARLTSGGEPIEVVNRRPLTYVFAEEGSTMPHEPLSSAEIIRWLRSKMLPTAADSELSPSAYRDLSTLVDACLGCRLFLFRPIIGWHWLLPPTQLVTEDQRGAALRLAALAPNLPVETIPVSKLIVWIEQDREYPTSFFDYELEDPRDVQVFRIVRLGGQGEMAEAVSTAVGANILARRWASVNRRAFVIDSSHKDFDPWLQASRSGDTYRLHPESLRMLADISRRATALRPAFLADYEIELASPWPQGAPDSVAIRLHHRGDVFDITVVGSGIAIWAAYSVLEALRQEVDDDATVEDDTDAWVADWEAIGGFPPNDRFFGGLKPDEERRSGRADSPTPVITRLAGSDQTTIYLFDEPERHLHPIAQAEAADWLAERGRHGRTQMFVATHSPAFLDIHGEQVEYVSVFRADDGATRARSLSADLLGELANYATDLGTTPAQRVQLTRAVLLVEGEHDRRVIDAFYGAELRRQRIRIQPIRGAKNARAIVEAETLAALGVPIFVMFDSVRSAVITGDREPKTGEEKRLVELKPLWDQRHSLSTLEAIPFSLPDIFAALPDDLVRAAAVRGRRRSWPGQEATERA